MPEWLYMTLNFLGWFAFFTVLCALSGGFDHSKNNPVDFPRGFPQGQKDDE
jgi:hypothetical protein